MRTSSILLGAFLCLVFGPVQAATTLLPNGMQCFTDANGAVISGSINMFIPSTTTPKNTWKDSGQSTLNTNPIQLDVNGCAVIYGVGQYRQQVFTGPVVSGAVTGNLLFDQLTADTSAFNSVFWAGLSGGTPNVITIVDTGFNATDGTVINFTALMTNTGATTINPSGFGAISVVKDTGAGPVALTGGEIVATNVISVVYKSSGNQFHLLNTAIASASGNTAPLCGATNLKIQNDVSTPNLITDITADNAVMISGAGVPINRSAVSVTVNISLGSLTSTAGGMDGEAPGTSAWIDLFLIDNGSAASGLGSLAAGNGKAPNMPSGYTFKCFLGAMRVDGSGNLLRTLQRGARAQYTLVSPSNTATYPSIASGSTSSVMTSESLTAFVPPTASVIFGALNVPPSITCKVAMNATTSFTQSVSDGITAAVTVGSEFVGVQFSGIIESTNIFYGSTTSTCNLFAQGWIDQVPAN